MLVIDITNHARRRLRQRLGLNTKAAKRQAYRAFHNGKIVQALNNNQCALIEYQGNKYVYGLNGFGSPVLITVMPSGVTTITGNNAKDKRALREGWNH